MNEHDDFVVAAPSEQGSWLFLLHTLPPLVIVAGVLFHPTQVTVYQWVELLTDALGMGHSLKSFVPAVNVTLSDLLFLAGFMLWATARLWDGSLFSRLRTYPVALLLFFAAGLISVLPFLKFTPAWAAAPVIDYSDAIKQIVQFGFFFVCAFIPLGDYLRSNRWRRWLLAAFSLAVIAALLVGLMEYVQFRPPAGRPGQGNLSALHIDATFGFAGEAAGAHEQVGTRSNRNVLGGWLTLVIPLFFAAFLWSRDTGGRLIALMLCAVGAVLLLHGGLWVAAVISVLALAFARGLRWFLASAVGLFFVFGLLFWLAPQQPDQILLDSVMLRRSQDRFRTLPVYSINPELDKSGRPADLSKSPYSPWEQKYIQWQPSLLALARYPISGVGLGSYQDNINQYYRDRDFGTYGMPKASMDLMEKGGNPFYAVWASETGFLGLFSILWLFLTFFRRAIRGGVRAARDQNGLELGLQAGVCAALGAAAFGALFTNYLVRGLGYTLVFVLALAGTNQSGGTAEEEHPSPATGADENSL